MRKRLSRLLDLVAPVRPPGEDRGYRRLLRWAALPVTDRRWAAPLAAGALGFGLFAGVAIGPGTPGTLATGAAPVIELPGLLAGGGEGGEGEPLAAGGGDAEAFPEGGGEAEAAFPEEEAGGSAFGSFPEAEVPAEVPAAPTPAAEEAPETEADEPAQTLAGLVVHANPAAGSYTVAEAGGLISVIHAAKLPAPGTRVAVPVRILANGTYAEDGRRRRTGGATKATIAGVVTFVSADPAAPAYAVSKRGVSVLVRVPPDPAGAAPVLPPLGAYAIVKAEIERAPTASPSVDATTPHSAAATVPDDAAPPTGPAVAPPMGPAVAPPAGSAVASPVPTCAPDPAIPLTVPPAPAVLWQASLDADGAPFASSDFAGIVTAVCAGEAKLAISGDDLRQAGTDLVFTVPRSIDLTGLEVGDSVIATASIDAVGALALTGLASDERRKGADDSRATQGDLATHKPR